MKKKGTITLTPKKKGVITLTKKTPGQRPSGPKWPLYAQKKSLGKIA